MCGIRVTYRTILILLSELGWKETRKEGCATLGTHAQAHRARKRARGRKKLDVVIYEGHAVVVKDGLTR